MKLGDVLQKERTRCHLGRENVAHQLGLSEPEYVDLEAGLSGAERWGPLLGRIAILLQAPTSRLVTESGRSVPANLGRVGALIRSRRIQRGTAAEEFARLLELSAPEYECIENGSSDMERYGPLLLRFAELVDQPIFNLLYPCGLPLEKVSSYP